VIQGVCQEVRQAEQDGERMRRGGRETCYGQDRGNPLVSPVLSLANGLHSIWLGLRTNLSL
jgi:hypothetical protein